MSTTSDSPAARPPEEEEDVPFSGFDEIENAFNRVSIVADSLLETIHDDSLRAKERERQRRRKQKRDNNSSRHRSGKSPSYYSDSSVDDDLTDYNNNTAARHSASKSNNSNRDSNMKTSPHTVTTTSSSHHHHHHHVDEVVHRNVVSPYDAYTSSGGYEDQDTTSPYTPNYYHDDDVSLLGDSVLGVDEHSLDGSLVQDVHNLKSLQKAMQADLMKAGEIFEANVTPTTEKFNKSFFQKLEAAADHDQNGKTPKTHNLNLKPLASIDIHRRGGSGRSKQKHLQQQQQQPQSPFFEQLREFIVSLLGDKPSLPLFVVNVFAWIVVFKMAFAAKQYLVGGDGQLASPVALAMTS